MNIEKICKALSNQQRIQILVFLKEPELHFEEMKHLPEDEKGKGYICVSAIQEKLGLTQSTVSQYLNLMKEAELLFSQRIGQWTYYRRNEKTIQEFGLYVQNEL